MENNYCVIMAGGIGSRFWPMSRTKYPKQFLDILGTGETLIQQTWNRFSGICPKENIYIVTNEDYRELIKEQLPDITDKQILCEPMRRNTAPCIAYANYKIMAENPDANIVVAPSDHIILKEDVFQTVIKEALEAAASNDWLITLGITPSRPDTGYGYIQFNAEEAHGNLNKVKTFTEKPELEMAKSFLNSGDFVWNAGIFIWNLKSINKAFETYLPEVDSIFKGGVDKYNTPEEESFINDAYTVCKNISIDYGVMENAQNVYVYGADFGWSDLGTWGSLFENSQKDDDNNAALGKNIMLYNSSNNIINVPDDKLVVLQGLDGYIVVERNNTLLVCKKEDEQMLRSIVNDVKIVKGEEYI